MCARNASKHLQVLKIISGYTQVKSIYLCNICKRGFSDSSNLKKHILEMKINAIENLLQNINFGDTFLRYYIWATSG
jgi:uncharacterized Zn-finger protein